MVDIEPLVIVLTSANAYMLYIVTDPFVWALRVTMKDFT